MKKCKTCQVEKELNCFWSKCSNCKPCQKEINKIYFEVNKESRAKRKKEWRLENLERCVTQDREYKNNNRDLINEKARKYYQNHKTECVTRSANRVKKFRQTKEGKEYTRILSNNRRAAKLKSEGNFTAKEFCAVLIKQDNKCYWCKNLIVNVPQADHYIPLSKNGSNDITNIVASCSTCNLSKGNKMPDEFLEYISKNQINFTKV